MEVTVVIPQCMQCKSLIGTAEGDMDAHYNSLHPNLSPPAPEEPIAPPAPTPYQS